MTAEAGLLSTAFNAHGYRFAYGATKTAALMCPAVPGSRSARRELFGANLLFPVSPNIWASPKRAFANLCFGLIV